MKVTLIGAGGGKDLLPCARNALEQADVIVGSPRLIEAMPSFPGRKLSAVKPGSIMEILLKEKDADCVVVFSGDTGFYSGAAALLARLRENRIPAEMIPGVSSVQLFAARLGRPWQDWTLCSAHGTRIDLFMELRKGKPVFLLTGSGQEAAEICRELEMAGLGDCTVTVGERLSYPDERIRSGPAREIGQGEFQELNVMLIETGQECLPLQRTPGLPDSAFIRGSVPMTKQETRAVILAKMAVRPMEVCWDVGAGTGSVSVELALAAREVWAVERQEEACSLIRQNRQKFRAWNLRLVEGEAPEALSKLPRPDAVFVGGSSGHLEEILDMVNRANPQARICVSAIALESCERAVRWMEENGREAEIVQIYVSRAREAGGLHLLLANNPVFLISGGLL